MEVLLSSPGVDLTTALVERFRRDPAAQLIVPTATLGEHLRNELARKGELVRPHRITTFSKLLFSAAEGFTTAPSSALEWLVGELLERSAWRSFEPVRHAPGFRRALVGVAEELHAAGASAIDVSRISADDGVTSDLASLLAELETNCREHGW
ncbi:MAG TPA: hypothetical protein VE621_23380, partial [Bryobacteraceae bacterium]|nr:hypothetical protein [Bryobacteraceae bacterium]